MLEDGPDPDDLIDPEKMAYDTIQPMVTLTLRGSTMLHTPGILRYAQAQFSSRSKKNRQNAIDILKGWLSKPEHEPFILPILKGECEVTTSGDDAIVRVRRPNA